MADYVLRERRQSDDSALYWVSYQKLRQQNLPLWGKLENALVLTERELKERGGKNPWQHEACDGRVGVWVTLAAAQAVEATKNHMAENCDFSLSEIEQARAWINGEKP